MGEKKNEQQHSRGLAVWFVGFVIKNVAKLHLLLMIEAQGVSKT